jgi:hypothetical protein
MRKNSLSKKDVKGGKVVKDIYIYIYNKDKYEDK